MTRTRLIQLITLEKQSLAAHERELELLDKGDKPKKKNLKLERVAKYRKMV